MSSELTSKEDKASLRNNAIFATAIARNDISLVQQLLESCTIDVNGYMLNGKTPLIEATKSANAELVDLLIKHNANPRLPCPSYLTTGSFNGSEGQKLKPSEIYPLEVSLKHPPNAFIIKQLLISGAEPRDFNCSYLDLIKTVIAEVQQGELLVDMLLPKLEKESSSTSAFRNQVSHLLVTAVSYKKAEVVRVLLDNGANANQLVPGNNKMIPVLVLAANGHDLDTCNLLLNAGAVLNQISYIEDDFPLTCAVDSGLTQAVDTLIKLGAEVNVCPHHHAMKSSLIHVAVAKRYLSIVSLLLNAGATIRAAGKEGNSPLHIACREDGDQHQYLSLLLSKLPENCDMIDKANTRKQTALLLAVVSQNIECMKIMIQVGADVNKVVPDGESLIHEAIRVGNDQVVELLIEAGVNLDVRNRQGCTPLLCAVWNGDTTITEMLIDSGADPLAVADVSKESTLHFAVTSENPDMFELLLSRTNVDIDGRNETGDTPLMQAARSSCPKACKILTAHNANMNLTDYNQEETALSLAVYFGKEDNAYMLMKEGADITIADQSGLSPLYWAFFNCRIRPLAFMVLLGARLTPHQLKTKYPATLSAMRNKKLVDWLYNFLEKPRSLQDHCRLSIRRGLAKAAQGSQITSRINALQLPERLLKYLRYDTDELPDLMEGSSSSRE